MDILYTAEGQCYNCLYKPYGIAHIVYTLPQELDVYHMKYEV